MGFFSQDCSGCGHPMICPQAVSDSRINAWMCEVVSISPSAEIHMGTYDGYGRVGGAEEAVGFDATVFHRACWELAGSPLVYRGASEPSADQGWFFADEHDVADPRLSVQL